MSPRKVQATLHALGLRCARCAGGIEVRSRTRRCFCLDWREALEAGIAMFEREIAQ